MQCKNLTQNTIVANQIMTTPHITSAALMIQPCFWDIREYCMGGWAYVPVPSRLLLQAVKLTSKYRDSTED